MIGIFYKEGVYVVINHDAKNESCVYHYKYKYDEYLFGGRVHIQENGTEDAFLTIDGISIIAFRATSINEDLSISTIASHLNAIETNGVDAFLEHYKNNIEFAYNELKELKKETEFQLSSESNDSLIEHLKTKLKKLQDVLFAVFALLLGLKNYMSAGLENEKVISVCQSIIDSLV